MTAAAPARPVTARAFGLTPLPLLRLLRIELRRSTMPWLLPLIAALFWFDSYRPSTGMPPLYVLRTFWNMGQGHTIIDFGPFVAGAAAWTGSRDGRRRTADLVAGTARPRWAAQLAAWAAAAIWAVAAYLAFTGAMFAAYAGQGCGDSRRGGGPRPAPRRSRRSARPGSRPARTGPAGSPRRWPPSAGSWRWSCRRRRASGTPPGGR
jgi:hypothetical protein